MSDITRLKKALKKTDKKLIVNRAELAEMLDVTEPTIDKHMKQPGFPVHEKGRNGVSYKFKLYAVLTWWIKRAEAEAKAEAVRQKGLKQIRFELQGGESAIPDGLSLTEQKTALELMSKSRAEAERQGQLVPIAEIRLVFEELLLGISSFFRNLPYAMDDGEVLSQDQIAKLITMSEDQQVQLHDILNDILNSNADKKQTRARP